MATSAYVWVTCPLRVPAKIVRGRRRLHPAQLGLPGRRIKLLGERHGQPARRPAQDCRLGIEAKSPSRLDLCPDDAGSRDERLTDRMPAHQQVNPGPFSTDPVCRNGRASGR